MGNLSLAVLGPPEIHHSGQAVAYRTRKVLALLIYLAVEGRLHSRESLIALLWPESDEEHGRMLLRRTLLLLRQALHEHTEVGNSAHLLIEHDALGCNFASGIDLDVQPLQRAVEVLRELRGVLQRPMRSELLAQLQTVVNLYKGSFLDGFALDDAPDFDNWTRLQRETWHHRIVLVFEQLSRLQYEGGELLAALETAIRWVALDPLNETAYRRLMQSHLAMGDRGTALRVYEKCRRMLAEQLHAQPAAETEVLAERARSEHTRLARSQNLERRAPTSLLAISDSGGRVPATSPALLEVPLVGRAQEFGTLIQAYRSTESGQARIAIIRGEAGIGKTRLAQEFLGWALAQGADVLQGRAFESGGRLPYQPLVAALRGRIELENAPDDLLSDTWLAELSRLLPELRDRYQDLPLVAEDEGAARIRLFEAITRLGEAFAECKPVVLFIDDVQWADVASLDALQYAGRRWREDHVAIFLLFGVRTESLSLDRAVSSWFAALERDLLASAIELGPILWDDTLQLLQFLEGNATPAGARATAAPDVERFSRWLFSETLGHPFYVIEMLKALLERGILTPSLREDGRPSIEFGDAVHEEARLRGMLPSNIRELILARLPRRTSPAFTLLAGGAVLGRSFTFEQAYQVADLSEHEGLAALDEVLAARLLQETIETTGDGQSTYFFTHDKIRDVVYTEAGDARRRVFHRRALECLRIGTSQEAELAHHAHAAGLNEPTFHLSLTAGDKAMRLFAIRDAIVQYEQARLSGARFTPPQLDMKHLYEQLGRAYELNNQLEQARALYQVMLAWAREMCVPFLECAALNRLATLAMHSSLDVEQARSLLQQALHMAEQGNDIVGLAETEWNMAHLNYYSGDASSTFAHGTRALELARKLGKQELIAQCLNVVAYAKLLAGEWEGAVNYAEEARAMFQALRNRAMERDCLCQLAHVRISAGQPAAGITIAREALSISREAENFWGQADSYFHLAMGLLEMGTYSEALTCAQQTVAIARAHNIKMLLSIGLATVGRVFCAMLDPDAARAAQLEVVTEEEGSALPPSRLLFAAEFCTASALAGAWEEAYRYALQELESGLEMPYMYRGLSRWYVTEALIRAGDIEHAAEDVQRYGARFGHSRRHRIPYLRSLAVLAEYRIEFNKAIQHLQEAWIVAKDIGLPGELWSIRGALGRIYLLQKDQVHARAAFEEAAATVNMLADSIKDERQRAAFLRSEQVRSVVETHTNLM